VLLLLSQVDAYKDKFNLLYPLFKDDPDRGEAMKPPTAPVQRKQSRTSEARASTVKTFWTGITFTEICKPYAYSGKKPITI
jgi:hypothetical protein